MAETISTMFAQPFSLDTSYAGSVVDQDSASTSLAAGSNGATLPQAVVYVASTAGLTASGVALVKTSLGYEYVTYTGKVGGGTPNITGCTGGTGVMTTGDGVYQVRAISFNPSGTVWYRTYLAQVAGAGASHTDPKEFLLYCQTIIRGGNSRWTVTMRSDGKVRILYSGTGFGLVLLPSVIGTLLGFTTLSHNLSTGSIGDDYDDGTNSPTHTIFSHWRDAPQSWRGQQVGVALSEMDDGRVDFLGGTYSKITRAFSLRGHPRTPTDATALGMITTPVFPDELYATSGGLWQVPSLAPVATAIPWSVHQFLMTSKGKELGYTLGHFQQLIAASDTYYDEGYWTAKTLASQAMVTVAGWEQLNDQTELEVTRTGHLVIT